MFSVVTGKLGGGKSLFVASLIDDAANRGRRIVANFELNFSKYEVPYPLDCTIIPTKPTSKILQDLGRGSDREDKPGLLIIDEGAMILNSRTWNDKDRDNIISWFLMSRKLNWDVYVIIQHTSALDKQIREMLCEIYITCMRLDRIKIPLLGAALPRVHIAVGRYGSQPGAPVTERWMYRGNKKLFSLYNTAHIFDPDKVEVVKKVHAKIKKNLMYYLNQPITKENKDALIIAPLLLVPYIIVYAAKLVDSFCSRPRSPSSKL